MNTPLVSVIIPVYNCELYLEKCISNMLKQTYRNLQIIFVDDGSTDDSLKICKEIKDTRVEVYSKSNGGASTARNYGLKYRKGKYVLFVDSDDYLKENAIESLVNKAVETNADCVYFEGDNFTDDAQVKVKVGGLLQSRNYPTSNGIKLLEAMLVNKNYHAAPVLYFTKSSLYDKGLSFEEGIMFEDELFTFNLLRMCNKVVCLKEVLYYRYVRQNSVMTSKGKELFRFHSISTVYKKLYQNFSENKSDKVYLMYLSRIAMLWLDYWEKIPRNSKIEVRDIYLEIKKQILDNKGFENKELVARCYGKYVWIAYILPGRLFNKLKRKLSNG